ncbi:hypothetical protein [Streptomyces sp. HB2AG]|uniref:hypothetical protein n=1 Tax=Streptomyces sp. HB2AG TaxID=2983400 RepID=UPI0022AA6E69|nr:hypothetical protein [Streptomyces sp. HB2AG]MCZ2523529.1 hypothetical protein [Streptomyces sp. HB2AG]
MFRTRAATACRTLAVAALTAAVLAGCRSGDDAAPTPDGPATPATAPAAPSAAASPAPTAPAATAAPAGGRRLVDAAEAGGLKKLTGPGALSDVPVDPGEMTDGMNLVAGNFAAPGSGDGGPVLFEGVDNVPEDTVKRREHLFRGMLDHVRWDFELGVPEAEPVDAGPLGGSVECLLASLAEDGNVVCGWADEGTAAVALFPDSTTAEAAERFVAMRADLER